MQEVQETWVWSLGQEDPLQKEMVIHSSILAWKIPWTVPGGLQSMELQRVGHNWAQQSLGTKEPLLAPHTRLTPALGWAHKGRRHLSACSWELANKLGLLSWHLTKKLTMKYRHYSKVFFFYFKSIERNKIIFKKIELSHKLREARNKKNKYFFLRADLTAIEWTLFLPSFCQTKIFYF